MRFLPDDDPRREVWERCESPIEKCLCAALFTLLGCGAVHGQFLPSRLPELAQLAGKAPAFFLFAQHDILSYRPDFFLVTVDPRGRTYRRLILECDGEAYHGSDEQIARDARRDAALEGAGYVIRRYSGSAIHSDLPEILEETKGWIERAGVTCATPADLEWYAGLLRAVTPGLAPQSDASSPIEVSKVDDEEAAEGEAEFDERCRYFVDESGLRYRWADTL
jgi:very-short-patch-repair endonuclease